MLKRLLPRGQISITKWYGHQLNTRNFKFLKDECGVTIDIGLIQYLFGISGSKYLGLNHVLLELKKTIFYSWDSNIENNAFCQQVKNNIKKIIIKEKSIMLKNNQYEEFDTKWDKFVSIYDFRGPDLQ